MPSPFLSTARRMTLALVILSAAVVYWVRWREGAEVRLLLGAGPEDADGYALAQAIAEVVERHHPRIRILPVATRGSSQNAELLASERLDMAILQGEIHAPPAARLIAPLHADAFQLLAREGSGIRSPGHLEGKNVALPPPGSSGFVSFWEMAEHYGMDESDLTALPMSLEAATWAMRSEAVDALFLSRPPGASSVRTVLEGGNAYLVPIEQAAAVRLKRPSLEAGLVPKGAYGGEPPAPPEDLPTPAVRMLLTGREGMDARLVREITGVLFERRRELMEFSPLAGLISSPDRGAGTFMPVHRGAQAYYDRERPGFLQENAEVIALLLSLGALGISSLLRMAQQGRRRRLEAYNAELLALYRNARETDDAGTVAEAKEETLQVLVRVLDDAEEGRVTEEGFHVFSLTWEAVYGALRDRLLFWYGPGFSAGRQGDDRGASPAGPGGKPGDPGPHGASPDTGGSPPEKEGERG